jgi:hypothetical protein
MSVEDLRRYFPELLDCLHPGQTWRGAPLPCATCSEVDRLERDGVEIVRHLEWAFPWWGLREERCALRNEVDPERRPKFERFPIGELLPLGRSR